MKKVNVQNLPKLTKPKFAYEPVDASLIVEKKKKRSKVFKKTLKTLFEKQIGAKNIVKDMALDQSDYMDQTQASSHPGGSTSLNLNPGVNLNERGKCQAGPKYDKQNRMTLHEYSIVANSQGTR